MKEKKKKIDWSKYSKDDRKFLIEVSIANREFCRTIAMFIYSTLISVSALLIAIYSVGVSISGLTETMIYIGIGILIIIGLSWIFVTRYYRKITKKWIPSFNDQYQEIHKSLHPELFKGGWLH